MSEAVIISLIVIGGVLLAIAGFFVIYKFYKKI